MLKWLANLFRRGTNGNGAKAEEAACEPTDEKVTRKNVLRHSQKITIDFERVSKMMDDILTTADQSVNK